jgi:hypothetical protein
MAISADRSDVLVDHYRGSVCMFNKTVLLLCTAPGSVIQLLQQSFLPLPLFTLPSVTGTTMLLRKERNSKASLLGSGFPWLDCDS